jgi:hypothetical protein
MLQFAFTGSQPLADLAQGMGARQLAKQHSHKLAPTGKATGVALGFAFADKDLELRPGEQMQKLTENAAYSFQGGASSVGLRILAGTAIQPTRGAASKSQKVPSKSKI